jgi:NACHT N-terminal Helical domain 1
MIQPGGVEMAGLEIAVISLGGIVVKSACKLWFGNDQIAVDASSQLVDMFAGRVSGRLEQRRLGRLFDECADIVAGRLSGLLAAEFSGIPENERVAAVLAVTDTFTAARLSNDALIQADLDARMVERQLRPASGPVLSRASLSEGGEQVYWLVLRESCSYLVEVVTTLPRFSAGALTELLRRETAILETISRVLDRLPERRGVDDFTTDYRRAVANRLDRLELLGVTLAEANRRYPLSIAYIDLSVMRQDSPTGRLVTKTGTEEDPSRGSAGQRAASVLGRSGRVLVVGHAGSGKTTLLQWLAVRSALGEFSGPLEGWAGTVPFFVPLRQYAGRALPAPEELPLAVGRNLARDAPGVGPRAAARRACPRSGGRRRRAAGRAARPGTRLAGRPRQRFRRVSVCNHFAAHGDPRGLAGGAGVHRNGTTANVDGGRQGVHPPVAQVDGGGNHRRRRRARPGRL